MIIKSVAVFLGSAPGLPGYMESAYDFGKQLALRGFHVIYGGAEVGTMKALTDGVLAAGGEITGVFPKGFRGKREIAAANQKVLSSSATRIIETKDMAERMATMNAMSDCCVIIPGGYGTLEELFTYAVDNEIGIHDKVAYVLNTAGYYDPLESMVATMKSQGFLRADSDVIRFVHSMDELWDAIGNE